MPLTRSAVAAAPGHAPRTRSAGTRRSALAGRLLPLPLVAVSVLTAAPAGAVSLPSASVGAPVVVDRGADVSDPAAAVDRAGTTYLAWTHAGVPRLCVLPPGAARCRRTTVLGSVRASGLRLTLGASGVVTLVWAAPGAPGPAVDVLTAATSPDGGTTFGRPVALAPLPAGSRLTSLASFDGAVLAAAVSAAGVTVRAVRLDQDAPEAGTGAIFPGTYRDAQLTLASTGPLLVLRVPGLPPRLARYGGEGTADDTTGWTAAQSFAGVDDGFALVPAGDDPVFVNRAGAGRRLQLARWSGTSFGRGTPLDTGGGGSVAAVADPTGRVTVVRGGGGAAGLVATSTARGPLPVDGAAPVLGPVARVLAARPAAGSVPAVAVAGDGTGVVAARTASGRGSALLLQRFRVLPPPPAAPPTGVARSSPSPPKRR